MLNFIRKGITYSDIIETIELLNSNNITIQINIILGWENLEKEDLHILKQFIDFLNTKTNYRIIIFRLFCIRGTPVYNIYKNAINIKQDSAIHSRGYYPILSKEKHELSLEAAEIIKKCNQPIYDYSGFLKRSVNI
jgi:radical SAM superfamily enzyme